MLIQFSFVTWNAENSTVKSAMGQATCAGAIVSMLSACCERGVGLRTTVQNSAVVQRAHFIPRALQPTGNWWFSCDEEVGLHFCPGTVHARQSRATAGRWLAAPAFLHPIGRPET